MTDAGVELLARVVQGFSRIQGMLVKNRERERDGLAMSYGEESFDQVHADLENAIALAQRTPGWDARR